MAIRRRKPQNHQICRRRSLSPSHYLQKIQEPQPQLHHEGKILRPRRRFKNICPEEYVVGLDPERGLRRRRAGAIGFELGLTLSLLCVKGPKQQVHVLESLMVSFKCRKAWKKRRPVATKSPDIISITQKADLPYQYTNLSPSNTWQHR